MIKEIRKIGCNVEEINGHTFIISIEGNDEKFKLRCEKWGKIITVHEFDFENNEWLDPFSANKTFILQQCRLFKKAIEEKK